MTLLKEKKSLMLILMAVLLIGISLILFVLQQSQDTRSRATAAATLSFAPTYTLSNPREAKVGDTVSWDIIVTPGSNLVGSVRLAIEYDSTKFAIPTTGNFLILNTIVFPKTLAEPLQSSPGRIYATASIGSNADLHITSPQTVGTLTLRLISDTNSVPTKISFGSGTAITSVGEEAQYSENVLSATTPTFLLSVVPTSTPTLFPTSPPTVPPTATTIPPTSTPTLPVTPTPTRVPTISPTASPTPKGTSFQITAILHGIGSGGDNVATQSSLSNKNPKHPERAFSLELFTTQNKRISTYPGILLYNASAGNYTGSIDGGLSIPSGVYQVRVKVHGLLGKIAQDFSQIKIGQLNILPTMTLVAGDVDDNNRLTILDYNILIHCYDPSLPASACTASKYADLNDDDVINIFDYNLFVREISVLHGDQ